MAAECSQSTNTTTEADVLHLAKTMVSTGATTSCLPEESGEIKDGVKLKMV